MRQRVRRALQESGPLLGGLALIAAVGAGFAWGQPPEARGLPTTADVPTAVPERPTGTVRGVVHDVDGAPAAGVVVEVVTGPFVSRAARPSATSSVLLGPTWSDTTDADGTYEIPEVDAGPHRLVVSPDGGLWATWWFGGAATVDLARDFRVDAQQDVVLDLDVLPAASIRGTVAEPGPAVRSATAGESGDVAAATEVVLERRTGRGWTTVSRSAVARSGEYEVDGLLPGDYRVLADSPRSGITYAPSAASPAEAQLHPVAVGESVDVDVEVPPPATVTGRLTTSAGTPLPGREIGFSAGWVVVDPRFPPIADQRRTVRTDASGHFAVRLGTGEWSAHTDPRCVGTGTSRLDVVAGRDGTWALVDDAVATLSGRVVRPDGTPRSGVRVSLGNSRAACGQSATTDKRGRWRIARVPPGPTLVEYVVDTPRGTQFRSYHPGVRKPADSSRIDVALGARVTGLRATVR
ncbi:carboxypeptidase-like regulatory domain-containing protein [Nocardioides jishulii]|uniref:carboxypeptidase-like regulatory domain-containing protein n=1 Tax=Nocardioides jishulii TaxID=2575440 RepID=UPI001585DDBD|nr:carboxypeptidase-like regulatory domain-containing protein [Nocardioides jishulii]